MVPGGAGVGGEVGGDVEVAGAAAGAAHVAYPGGGVGEAVELLHGGGSVVPSILV